MTPSAPVPTTELDSALHAASPLLSQPSDVAITKAHHRYRQVTVASAGHVRIPEFASMLASFAPVRDAWLSWIEPGGYVVEHIDAGPHYERWQIPFSAAGRMVVDDEPIAHEVGVPFRVEHHRWHRVENDSDEPRVSLVVDRDVVVSATRSPLRLTAEPVERGVSHGPA